MSPFCRKARASQGLTVLSEKTMASNITDEILPLKRQLVFLEKGGPEALGRGRAQKELGRKDRDEVSVDN